jgi:hypothetical protein
MVHSISQIVLGYLLWKHFPSWLRLKDSQTIDHYVIVALSFIGIIMMLIGAFHLIECLLIW